MNRWNPGDKTVLRELWQDRIWTARPVTVVEDSPEVIALYIANGSIWKRPFNEDGSPKRIPAGDWILGDELWSKDVIRVSTPGGRFSVLPIRNDKGDLQAWYLNIESPLSRTPLGFDYMDLTLDIIVDADLSGWRWKDEEELAEAVARGVYTQQQANDIRASGEQALARFLARKPPFDRAWNQWQPDPAWDVPQLAGDWETLAQT